VSTAAAPPPGSAGPPSSDARRCQHGGVCDEERCIDAVYEGPC
jgi:hypothetical protein